MGLFYTLLCLFGQCVNCPYKFTLYGSRGGVNLHNLDPTLRTIFIVHGWQQSGQQPWVIQMKNAYLDNVAANVVVLDWSDEASAVTYYPSAYKVPDVGQFLGQALYLLQLKRLIRAESTQLVGFSLGAHVAGYAGQTFAAKSNGTKIKTIVGLDAASSLFESLNDDKRLDASDADFVQSFHTSAGGMRKRYGTVDVYFNRRALHGCGLKQPSCPSYAGVDVPPNSLFPIVFCDHLRAVAYFIQTITTKNFVAVACTCDDFYNKRCNATQAVAIGEHISPSTPPGEYFLSTSCKLPFGLGHEGIIGGSTNYDC